MRLEKIPTIYHENGKRVPLAAWNGIQTNCISKIAAAVGEEFNPVAAWWSKHFADAARHLCFFMGFEQFSRDFSGFHDHVTQHMRLLKWVESELAGGNVGGMAVLRRVRRKFQAVLDEAGEGRMRLEVIFPYAGQDALPEEEEGEGWQQKRLLHREIFEVRRKMSSVENGKDIPIWLEEARGRLAEAKGLVAAS
jgi:hypothetical protein